MSNQNYIRYSDTAGIATSPQPLSTPGTVDPGDGWETKPYLNFNGDYRKFDDDCIALPPGEQPAPNGGDYVRYSDTPGITTNPPQPYERN